MVYSRAWLLALSIVVASSDKVTGYLLRNSKGSSDDVTHNETTFSDQFKNHEGGVIDSPSGFLCLEVKKHGASYRRKRENGKMVGFSCRYKREGEIVNSKLGDVDGIFNEHFQQDRRLFLKGATYKESTNTIRITSEVEFIWLSTEGSQTKTKIEPTGLKTVLVFHITSNGEATTGSPSTLSNWVFGTGGNQVNLISTYEECSYDQLRFTPATGKNIVNGVVKVNISPESNHFQVISATAVTYATNQLGVPVDSFDHLMFTLPRSATDGGRPPDWDGYGEIPGRETWFRDGAMKSVSLQAHEIGHNLGLEHSEEGWLEYGDETCRMGYTDDAPQTRKCFNAAKMKQLGWYKSRERSIDPLREQFSGKIIGVNDFGKSGSSHVLVLEIIDSSSKFNLYVTYNRAEGMNQDTSEYKNQITVDKARVKPPTGSYSELLEHIKVGSSATFPNFSDSGRALIISFTKAGADGDVNYASITVKLGSDEGDDYEYLSIN